MARKSFCQAEPARSPLSPFGSTRLHCPPLQPHRLAIAILTYSPRIACMRPALYCLLYAFAITTSLFISDVPRGFPTLAALDLRVSAGVRAHSIRIKRAFCLVALRLVSNLTLLVYPLDA